MRYAWIDVHRREYKLTQLCKALLVSVNGYRSWTRRGSANRKRLTDVQTMAPSQAVHDELKGAYGSPRIVRELQDNGCSASKERVERLMWANGTKAGRKRLFKATTDSKHALAAAPNQLARSGLQTGNAKSGLECLSDLYLHERRLAVPGRRSRSGQPRNLRLVDQAAHDLGHRHRCADHGVVPRTPAPRLIPDSQRRSQYASHVFQARLQEYGMRRPMTRKGTCWDNAPILLSQRL